MSILLKFVVEFAFAEWYSAPGVYSTVLLNWLSVSTAIEKSDEIGVGNRLESLPPLIRLELRLPMYFGIDVWVGI